MQISRKRFWTGKAEKGPLLAEQAAFRPRIFFWSLPAGPDGMAAGTSDKPAARTLLTSGDESPSGRMLYASGVPCDAFASARRSHLTLLCQLRSWPGNRMRGGRAWCEKDSRCLFPEGPEGCCAEKTPGVFFAPRHSPSRGCGVDKVALTAKDAKEGMDRAEQRKKRSPDSRLGRRCRFLRRLAAQVVVLEELIFALSAFFAVSWRCSTRPERKRGAFPEGPRP